MSILIRGMEMPKKCEQCWFFGTDSARVGYCYLLKGELPLPDGVPQDCPLVEVPTPHGDLIDKNALTHKYYKKASYYHLCDCLNNAPTVIESDHLRDNTKMVESEGKNASN